jgi:hypothetical protein
MWTQQVIFSISPCSLLSECWGDLPVSFMGWNKNATIGHGYEARLIGPQNRNELGLRHCFLSGNIWWRACGIWGIMHWWQIQTYICTKHDIAGESSVWQDTVAWVESVDDLCLVWVKTASVSMMETTFHEKWKPHKTWGKCLVWFQRILFQASRKEKPKFLNGPSHPDMQGNSCYQGSSYSAAADWCTLIRNAHIHHRCQRLGMKHTFIRLCPNFWNWKYCTGLRKYMRSYDLSYMTSIELGRFGLQIFKLTCYGVWGWHFTINCFSKTDVWICIL